jgi:CubicO group peptidase (beta-lactamase class C family)
MRLIPVLLLLRTLLPGADLPVAAPESAGVSSERLKRLDAVMEEYVRERKVAGAVTYIARHGKIVQHRAYGMQDVESGRRMDTGTLFRIASQTKAVTSVAVMMLVEEGKIRLGDPVAKFLPAFRHTTVVAPAPAGAPPGAVPAKRPITIRDLLTHTAGISYGTNAAEPQYKAAGVHMWYFADKDERLESVIDRIAKLPFDAQPGEKWVYGFNTDILGRVVEVASGMPLDEFFARRIFEPLAMKDTFFFVPRDKAPRLAVVYGIGEDGRIRRAPDRGREGQGEYVDGPRKCFAGGAGLVSTAADYGRFLQMLLNGGELFGARLLSPASVRAMISNQTGSLYTQEGMGFGLGFAIVEDIGRTGRLASLGEFGWGGAYFTTYWVAPAEGVVAQMMTQLLPAGGSDLQDKFRTLVYQALVDAPSLAPGRR